jgi:hypothetical protein
MNLYAKSLLEKWPEINHIPIDKTWNWLLDKTRLIEGMSVSRLDRALNALSYVFESNNFEDIFYLLMGIEALYNKGRSEGIMEQIERKVMLLLGSPPEFKKKIKKMYEVRSDFLHGRFDFPKRNHEPYLEDYDNPNYYRTKYSNSTETAALILVATLQKLILANATSIEEENKLILK